MTEGRGYKICLGDVKIGEDCLAAVREVLRSGQLTEAYWTAKVEADWAAYIGTKEAIAVPNGTIGLHLAYMVSCGPVATSALTFPATINPAILLDKKTYLVDTDGLFMSNLHPGSRTQVPVHLMGIPHPKIRAFKEECDKKDWTLIEDACEAAGAELDGKKVGSFGHMGVFSFYVSHNISAGEYGLITTSDVSLANEIRSLKNHGRKLGSPPGYFSHSKIGMNYKVSEVNSCIAWYQLKQSETIKKKRLETARRYQSEIINPFVTAFRIPPGSSLLGMPLEVREDDSHTRDALMDHLFSAGIEVRAMFPSLNLQRAYGTSFGEAGSFPNAERLSARALYIPCCQSLTDDDITTIIARINVWK